MDDVESIYAIKELFFTLQGEGANCGRSAVFIRFTGCNLWSGRERDRGRAVCKFCDTDFVGVNGTLGGRYRAQDLAEAAADLWPTKAAKKFVVCTGGEPLLQLDEKLIDTLHKQGFEVAVETNGTIAAPHGLDWITVSPKSNAPIAQPVGNELKLVYPQLDAPPERFESLQFDHFFLQPMDGPSLQTNTQKCIEYCMQHPTWRLSIQTHKLLGLR